VIGSLLIFLQILFVERLDRSLRSIGCEPDMAEDALGRGACKLDEKRMAAGDRSDAEIWKRYGWEFHHALISVCGSHVLLETHATIYDRYLRYQMIERAAARSVRIATFLAPIDRFLFAEQSRNSAAIMRHPHRRGPYKTWLRPGLGPGTCGSTRGARIVRFSSRPRCRTAPDRGQRT
jgi:hypothetical protein